MLLFFSAITNKVNFADILLDIIIIIIIIKPLWNKYNNYLSLLKNKKEYLMFNTSASYVYLFHFSSLNCKLKLLIHLLNEQKYPTSGKVPSQLTPILAL